MSKYPSQDRTYRLNLKPNCHPPPQMIISLPVQTAVCESRASGGAAVAVQVFSLQAGPIEYFWQGIARLRHCSLRQALAFQLGPARFLLAPLAKKP